MEPNYRLLGKVTEGVHLVESVHLIDSDGLWNIYLDLVNPKDKVPKPARVELVYSSSLSSPASWLQFLWLRDRKILVAKTPRGSTYIKQISAPKWADVQKRYRNDESTAETL